MIHDVLEQVNHQLVIPGLLVNALAILAGIETDLVHVPHDVKSSRLDHCHHLGEKRLDHILNVVVEVLAHASFEPLELAVDVHHLVRVVHVGDEVDRPDAVIQRQLLEIVAGGTVVLIHIVNLH